MNHLRTQTGTAGLRGQMGPGYGKMNELTVLQATDGLCTYLVDVFGEDAARERGIVIGYDHRAKGSLSSERFASLASKLASSRGFRVYKYSDLVATPLVPYGVINKNSLAGVMITASHNPGQDNGYKVYWENGAQIIPPHDRGIAERIDQSRDNWSTRHSELSDFGVFDDGHINCTLCWSAKCENITTHSKHSALHSETQARKEILRIRFRVSQNHSYMSRQVRFEITTFLNQAKRKEISCTLQCTVWDILGSRNLLRHSTYPV